MPSEDPFFTSPFLSFPVTGSGLQEAAQCSRILSLSGLHLSYPPDQGTWGGLGRQCQICLCTALTSMESCFSIENFFFYHHPRCLYPHLYPHKLAFKLNVRDRIDHLKHAVSFFKAGSYKQPSNSFPEIYFKTQLYLSSV